MHICTIRSVPMDKTIGPVISESGYFEVHVQVGMEEASATGDPKGYVSKKIVDHLAQCFLATQLPLNEGLWSVEFTPWAQNNLNFPKGFIT